MEIIVAPFMSYHINKGSAMWEILDQKVVKPTTNIYPFSKIMGSPPLIFITYSDDVYAYI